MIILDLGRSQSQKVYVILEVWMENENISWNPLNNSRCKPKISIFFFQDNSSLVQEKQQGPCSKSIWSRWLKYRLIGQYWFCWGAVSVHKMPFRFLGGVAATVLQSCYRKVKSLPYSLLIICSRIRGGASLGWSPYTWGNPGYLRRMHSETSGIPTFPNPDIA